MEQKKIRGSNYSAKEKTILLDLVKKYQNIIENKETKGHMILKKRQAWDAVCQQYNAVAESGYRTWKQLRHLYENLKQRLKKSVAIDNWDQFYEKTMEMQRRALLVKKEIDCTGSGIYTSTLPEQNASQDQPSPYEDASLYFDIQTEIEVINVAKNKSSTSAAINTAGGDKCIKKINKNPGVERKKHPNIKEQYFKTKFKNAKLETKYLMNKNKMEINKYRMEMKILKTRLMKLTSRK